MYDVQSTALLYIPALMYSGPPSVEIHQYLTKVESKVLDFSAATLNFLLCQLGALIGRGFENPLPLMKMYSLLSLPVATFQFPFQFKRDPFFYLLNLDSQSPVKSTVWMHSKRMKCLFSFASPDFIIVHLSIMLLPFHHVFNILLTFIWHSHWLRNKILFSCVCKCTVKKKEKRIPDI